LPSPELIGFRERELKRLRVIIAVFDALEYAGDIEVDGARGGD
jgi:hypothetical protein